MDLTWTLKKLLEQFNLKADNAFDGKQAIKKINQKIKQPKCGSNCCRGYSIIFMDCNMPVMNGYTASKIIKKKIKDQIYPPMLIIAVTAYALDTKI